MHPVKHGVEEEKKPEGNKGTDGIIFTFIMKIQTLLRGKSVTVLVYLTFVNLGKEKLYLQSKSEGGIVGGLLTLAATTALHHKELSFVCSDKGNAKQKSDGFRRLPLAPAAEINDRDEPIHTHISAFGGSACLLSLADPAASTHSSSACSSCV